MRGIQVLVVLFAAIVLAGCATTTRTETRKMYTETTQVAVGDDVRVTTRDGRALEFRVTAVDAKTIQGKGISVARADVASMKTYTLSTVTTRESTAEPIAHAVGTTISTAVIVWGIVCVVALLAFA